MLKLFTLYYFQKAFYLLPLLLLFPLLWGKLHEEPGRAEPFPITVAEGSEAIVLKLAKFYIFTRHFILHFLSFIVFIAVVNYIRSLENL